MKENESKPVFLATCALRRFWDTSQTILFLSSRCYPSLDPELEGIDAIFIDEIEQNLFSSRANYNLTIDMYEELLPKLASWMNELQGVNYSLKYWRILIGPYIFSYIQMLYLRYMGLQYAYVNYPALNTIVLAEESFITPVNSEEALHLVRKSDGWNLQICSQLIKLAFDRSTSEKPLVFEEGNKVLVKKNNYNIFTRLQLSIVSWITRLQGTRSIVVASSGSFSSKSLFYFFVKSAFRIVPAIPVIKKTVSLTNLPCYNSNMRSGLTSIKVSNRFLSLVLDTLKKNMPLSYLEHYHELRKVSNKVYPYKKVGSIIGGGWVEDDITKFWGAECIDAGVQLYAIQHGGAYGCLEYFSTEYIERAVSNGFISWGWKHDQKDIPGYMLTGENFLVDKWKKKSINKKVILYPITDYGDYIGSITSYGPISWVTYFDWQERFISSLDKTIIDQILLRVRPGTLKNAYLEKLSQLKQNTVPTQRCSFFKQLYQAKILISDNCQTTFLYGLAINIPTIIYWDTKQIKLNATFQKHIDDLEAVGIFHSSPESAAKKLNQIYSNPVLWWNTKEVQNVRMSFCKKYTRMPSNWLLEWKTLFLKIGSIKNKT